MTNPDPIPRGADLTDADLRLIVDDLYVTQNWAALHARMGKDAVKEQCYQSLRALLGGRPLVIGGSDA